MSSPLSSPASLVPRGTTAVEKVTNQPDQSSGWHQHHGTHVVTVLSGAITIVDGECNTRTYGPGESYVGGEGPHLARNSHPDQAHMVVTYVLDPGWSAANGTVAVPPPVGCTAP